MIASSLIEDEQREALVTSREQRERDCSRKLKRV